MESEANAPGAGSSVFNHPPRPRVTPTVVAAHSPVQAPAAIPAATMPDAEQRTLEDQRRRGGQLFYWIAGLSLINAVLAFSGQDGASSSASASHRSFRSWPSGREARA
jgi:hypothetical protein